MGICAAAQVVVEEAVAADGQRGGGDLAGGSGGEGEPGAVGFEQAVEVGGAEEVALGGGRAVHRLLIGGEEAGPLGDARLGAGNQIDLVTRAAVLVDPVAVAGAALRRQQGVGDLDDVALGGAGEWGIAERVADERRDESRRREVDDLRIERRCGRGFARYAVQSSTAVGIGESWVPVGGDRVERIGAGDLADDQRRGEL